MSPPRRPRAGLSLIEVVVATMVMATVAVPLFQLFQGGLRSTHATIHEVLGTHLAAELAEQLEAVPFDELAATLDGDEARFTSTDGNLEDGAPVGASPYTFHLSPLPPGFSRQLQLTRARPGLMMARVTVAWKVGTLPARTLEVPRALVRDSLLP